MLSLQDESSDVVDFLRYSKSTVYDDERPARLNALAFGGSLVIYITNLWLNKLDRLKTIVVNLYNFSYDL